MPRKELRDILRTVRDIEIRTNRFVDDTLAGQYHSVFKGRGMDFEEVREYVPGDDVRAIDWNVTARTGAPFVKSFREERELTILLMVDISASGDFGSSDRSKREVAAEVAASLAFSALRNGDQVGLMLFAGEVEHYVPPSHGRGHVLRLIHDLLRVEARSTGTDVEAAIDYAAQILNHQVVAVLLSDFCLAGAYDETLDGLKSKFDVMNRRHDLVAASICDPREMELPAIGLLTIEDAEHGGQVEIDTDDPAVRRAYADEARRRQDALRSTLGGCGVDLLELRTDEPCAPALLSFFGRRRARRAS